MQRPESIGASLLIAAVTTCWCFHVCPAFRSEKKCYFTQTCNHRFGELETADLTERLDHWVSAVPPAFVELHVQRCSNCKSHCNAAQLPQVSRSGAQS